MPRVSEIPNFEYQSIKSKLPLSTDELNFRYGRKDWELLSILTLPDGFEYVFKRHRKIEPEPVTVTISAPPNVSAEEILKTLQRSIGKRL